MQADSILPRRTEFLQAMFERDPNYEGVFFTAVNTTAIFCRPTCPARKPKPENVEFFATADDAMAAGYRPCKRCRPLDLPGNAPAWIAPFLEELAAGNVTRMSDSDLAARGLHPARVRRWFKKNTGMTFHRFLSSRALGSALEVLSGPGRIDQASLALGYESVSGFRHAFGRAFALSPGRAVGKHLLVYSRILTPIGPMMAMAEERGVVLLEFVDRPILPSEIRQLHEHESYVPAPGTNNHLEQLSLQLNAYFAGDLRRFEVPTLTYGSQFEEEVWSVVREIPFSATMSYQQVATHIGRSKAVRAVGRANGRNPIAIVVPCHRMIASESSFGGYGGGTARKAYLLKHEHRIATGEYDQTRFAPW